MSKIYTSKRNWHSNYIQEVQVFGYSDFAYHLSKHRFIAYMSMECLNGLKTKHIEY